MSERLREAVSGGKGMAIAIVLGVALVVGIAWAALRRPSNNENFPEGTNWVCKNGHQFTMTIKQLGDWHKAHYGQSPHCPTCGAEADRAEKCPHCGAVFPADGNATNCPVCKKPLTTGGD